MPNKVNTQRAEWAMNALETFGLETMGSTVAKLKESGDFESAITDLIADLYHACNANGLDAEAVSDRSWDHYAEEIQEHDPEDGEETDGMEETTCVVYTFVAIENGVDFDGQIYEDSRSTGWASRDDAIAAMRKEAERCRDLLYKNGGKDDTEYAEGDLRLVDVSSEILVLSDGDEDLVYYHILVIHPPA